MSSAEEEFFQRLSTARNVKETAPSTASMVEKSMERADPDFKTPLSLGNLFTHHDTHPVVLDFALLKAFGPSWFGWETPTLYQEIKRVFGTEISEHIRAKVQAIKTLHVSDGVWRHWQVFEKVCQALNNNIPHWDYMQALSLPQLYAGIDIIDSIRQETFDDEVKLYIAASVLNEDVFFVPPPLDFVQVEVSQPHYVCLDCGNEDSALFHDGICDTCTHKFDEENGLTFRPDQELIEQGKGKNLKLILKYDPDPVEKRWNEVEHLSSSEVTLDETQADVQVARLLLARDYMNIRRRQLAEQLVALKGWLGAA